MVYISWLKTPVTATNAPIPTKDEYHLLTYILKKIASNEHLKIYIYIYIYIIQHILKIASHEQITKAGSFSIN